jgi:hypothetical protein
VAGVGADYLIQNGAFYQHTGTGFSWTVVSGVNPLISNTGGLYHWQVPTSALGSGVSSMDVVFNGSGSSPDAYTSIITATLHQSGRPGRGRPAVSTRPCPSRGHLASIYEPESRPPAEPAAIRSLR